MLVISMKIYIGQEKNHQKELIMTITSLEYYRVSLYFPFMIIGSEVYHKESIGTLKLIKKIIKSRKWILILIGDLF